MVTGERRRRYDGCRGLDITVQINDSQASVVLGNRGRENGKGWTSNHGAIVAETIIKVSGARPVRVNRDDFLKSRRLSGGYGDEE